MTQTPAPPLEQMGIGSAYQQTLCQLLESSVLFRDFSRQEIETLVRYVNAYRATAHTNLSTEGELNNALMLITKGKVDIFKQTERGDARKLATVRAGSFLGEISLIDGFPHSATATTREETELVMLTRHNLDRLTDTYPKLGARIVWQIAWQLCARLRQTSGVLIDHLG